jgi:hypothetical protein
LSLNLNPIRHIFRISGMRICGFIFFLAITYCSAGYAQVKNEDDLKKQAEKYFEDEDYNLAYKLYAQLVSNYPKDPEFNYRLGVCMLYTEPDKKKPFLYLKIATNNPKDAPKDAKFYLAKTYHMNYQFDEALKLYNEYKQIGSSSSIKKLQVDREIEACKNGKRLLANLSDLVVITKKQLNEADYFRSYDVHDLGGKLLVKPDEFRSSSDKKKKEKSVIYLPRNGERIYYSSYGESGDRGRDIFYVNKLPNGSWSKPQPMPGPINTEYDEDYPFLHPNGKTLYFSSKGHNSMGGYDIFKTTYNDETQTWGKPINLDFPINSPDDDILFVTDSLEKTAYFSTGRYSPYGKIDVLKINTERRPMNFAVLKGTVVKEDLAQSLKSKITVKNIANGEIVGVYQAQDNGDYGMDLPNGGKFIFTVETPGITTQSEGVTIPVAYSLKPYKQVISYDKKILKIINYFDGQIADDNYAMMIDLIEKKAKLEVNENEPYNNSLKNPTNTQNAGNDNASLNAVNTGNPTINSDGGDNTSKTNTNKNITNEQLLEMAKTDAKEASDEAIKLKKEAEDAFGLATQKTAEAVAKQKEADDMLANANTISDISQKNEALKKATDLKEDAKIASDVANTATNMAKKLEVDANLQQQEADLTNQYIKEIEAVTKNKNNKEALAKLEQIQKQLDDLSKQKNQSDELYTSLKAESELKQNELKKSEKKSNDIASEINTINNEAKELEKDLSNETDNSIKENIKSQIKELTNEIESKNKDLAINNQKIENLKNEVDGVNKEIEIAAKMLNEKTEGFATNNDNTDKTEGAVNTNALPTNTITSLNYEGVTSKYKNEITINQTNKEDIIKQNEVITNYTKDVNDLIAIDKNEIAKSKDAAEKKKLNEEINNLEKQKSENAKLLASNNSKIKEIDSKHIANNTSNNTNDVTSETIDTKYKNELITNPTTKEDIIKQNEVITNYTKDIVDLINTDKAKLSSSKNATEKQKLNDEIQKLEKQKSENDNLLALNNTKINQLENKAITSNVTNTSTVNENNAITNTNNESNNTITNVSALNTDIKNETGDNTAYINELEKLKNSLNENLKTANDFFNYNKYKENSSITLKENASQKYNAAVKNESDLISLISKTEANLKLTTSADALSNEADALSNKAFKERQESTTKTGSEKESLLNQAIEDEKLALAKKTQLAELNQKENNEKFENNITNLEELKKLTGTKESNEISQANMLIDEAAINFNQAKRIRQEANAYPNGSAKLGGYSNAEEKENEALFKQQKALDVLTKVNPSYKLKTLNKASNPSEAISSVNKELSKTSQTQVDAFLALSKANQNELKLQGDKLTTNPNFKNAANKTAQDLKLKSDELKKEALDIVEHKALTLNPTEKATLLLEANKKEIEAIKLLNEANDALNTNNSLVSNNTPSVTVNTSTVNAVATQTTTNQTENTNSNNGNEGASNTNTTTVVSNNKTDNATATNSVVTNQTNDNNQVNNNLNNAKIDNAAATNSVVTNNNTRVNDNAASITNKGIGDEAKKLKASLNNTTENNLAQFNAYTNNDAISLKNKALEKINQALGEDKNLSTTIDNVVKDASQNSSGGSLDQQSISILITDADKLNDDAFKLRKSAATKTSDEKEKDLNDAKTLETQATAKKLEAANKQQQLNTATFNANKQSLEELALMAKGKNIAELNSIDMPLNEADLFIKQGIDLRNEANNYPSNAAKLGGYGNAEEKEALALQRQQDVLAIYKKYFSNYIPKQPNITVDSPESIAKFNETQASVNTNTQQHIDGLVLLTEANDKEYKSRFLNLTTTLNPTQTALKTKAQTAYKKNQTLLAQANQETNLITKKNLLIEVSKNGQDAINYLNQIVGNTPIASNNTNDNSSNKNNNQVANNNKQNNNNANVANNNQAANNNNANATNNNQVNNNANTTNNNVIANNNKQSNNNTNATNNVITKTVKLNTQELLVKNTNAYTSEKPIPIDEKIPDGLVFKVQIGAFKSPLPNNTFKGLSPVIAQTTPSGYIRYMAGNFQQYENANAVKNDLKSLGYNDAFVVAYYNGVRINLSEASNKAKEAGQNVELATSNSISAGLATNANIPKNNIIANTTNNTNSNSAEPVVVTSELEKLNGLLYTVQIGVYSKQVTRSQLFSLKPIYTEQLPSGFYRYTAGIYNQSDKIVEDKRKVVDLGVKDAFISAYYNGKRVPFTDGKKLQLENSNLKMETQNPIIFNGVDNTSIINNAPNTNINTPIVNTPTAAVVAFSNGVTTGPTPTPENGVKTDDAGISYKVQVGAYRYQVPNDVASKFLSIKTWPVNNVVINGLYIYTFGNFTGVSFAKKLRDEAVSFGITDAFITVYKDGKKLYGAEATQYLNK